MVISPLITPSSVFIFPLGVMHIYIYKQHIDLF